MAMEVGAAYVSIVPSFKGFGTELAQQIKSQTAGVGEKAGQNIGMSVGAGLTKAGRATDRFGQQLSTNVTLPVVGIAAASFNAFATFDQTIRQAGAALDLPAAGMEQLSDLALKMGKDTSFSAGSAADAMLELAKGGMTAAQIQGGGLQQTLTLAAAGGLELGSAATYMTNTLNTFGLGAKDAGAVAAALAGGANASTASVESLGMALSQVGPGARNAGLSLNDTVGALALFDQYGIKGSDAGTSLKTMLTRLVPQTDAAKTAMKALGLNFVDAQGNIAPLGNVAEQLKTKLGGLSEAQRTTALNTIFGSDASRAASVLMQAGSAELGTMTKATQDMGAAQRMAAVNTSGAAGSMEQLKGSLETAGITIGKALAPHITVLAQHITELVNAFTSLDSGTQHTVLVAAGLAAALGPVSMVLGKVTTGVGQTITGVTKLASATATAGKSMVAFGTGIAQPQSGLSAFASTSQRAGSAVGRFGQFVGGGLVKALAPVGKALGVVGKAIGLVTKAAWAFALTPIGLIIVAIVALAVIGVVLYKKWTPFRELVNKIGAGLVAFGKGALAVGRVVISALVTAAVAVGNAFQTAWRAIVGGWNAAKPVFATILNIVMTPLRAIILFVKGWINIIAGIFTGDFSRVGKGIGQALAGIVLFFIGIPMKIARALAPLGAKLLALGWSALVAMGKGIARGAVAVWNFFTELPGKAWSAAVALVSKLGELGWNALVAMAKAAARGAVVVWDFFTQLPGKAWSAAKSLVTKLASLGLAGLRALHRAIVSAAGAVWTFFSGLPGKVWSFLSGLPGKLASAGKSAMQALHRAIVSAASAVWTFFSGLPGRVVSGLGSLGSSLYGAGEDLIRGLVNGVRAMAGSVASAAKDVVGGAISAAKNALLAKSPSRVFIVIGRSVATGFIIGVNDGAAAASKATAALMTKVIAAANKAYATKGITKAQKTAILAQRNRMIAYVRNVYTKLIAPAAKKIDALAASITKTTAQLKSLTEARAAAFASIRDANLGGRDLFGDAMAGIAPDPAAVIARLRANLKALSNFRLKLAALVKLGLNAGALEQIGAQGAAAGGQMADVLLRSTPAQIKALNSTYAAIGTQADAVGNTVAGGMYDAGIKAAQGLLAGLQSQKAKLEKYLTDVANKMVLTLRKTLKIASPSKVMERLVGSPVGQGIIGGLEGERRSMDRALQSFISIPRAGTLASRLQPAGVAGGNVRVFIGERELTDIVRVEVDDSQTTQMRQLVNGRRV